ncbi:MAG TPA: hypothetical protein VFZ01_06785 [Geminicoccaceae bacterium]
MSRMIAEVYDAFRSAGAEDAQARAAATALAENDRRYDELRDDIRVGDSGLREELRRVELELRERINEVEQKLSARINEVEQKLSARINEVERQLSERIDRIERRLSVLEWNVRLNSVLLLGLLLKLIVFN